MTQKLLIITVGFFIVSCNSMMPKQAKEGPKQDLIYDSVIDRTHYILDTTLGSGNKISLYYNLFEDKLTADISSAILDTSFSVNQELAKDGSSVNPFNEIDILWSTNEFAGIRQGCGAPCYYEVIFPFISNERPRRYLFPYTNLDKGVHLEKNLIAYNGDHNTSDGFPMIKIKNLLSQKIDSIPVLSNWEPRVSMNEFIDTLYATNSFILIGQVDSSGKLTFKNTKKIDLD